METSDGEQRVRGCASHSRGESRWLDTGGSGPGTSLGKESQVSTCFARMPKKLPLWNMDSGENAPILGMDMAVLIG